MKSKVLHYVSIMDRAGEETFIMNVFRTINRSDIMFDFLVTANIEGEYDKEIHKLGGKIHHIKLINKRTPLKRLKNFFVLKKNLKSLHKEYTAIHIHTQHAMDAMVDAIAARLAGFRIVIVHSHSTSTLHHINAHYICRLFLNYLPIVRLACSNKAGKWLFGKNGKFEVVNNGIVADDFRFNQSVRDRVRKDEGWESQIIMGHVGSFSFPKNHSFLLDIFDAFLAFQPNSLLVMVGKGELIDEAKEKARKLGINDHVKFLGSRGDVNQLYSAFDILIFPSKYEGLPLVLVEAQCSGLPCIISDTITTEVDITDKITRLNLLKDTPAVWAKRILEAITENKIIEREQTYLLVKNNGYSMIKTTNRLTEIYCRKNIYKGNMK